MGAVNKKDESSIFWDFWGPFLLTIGLYLGIRTFLAEARYIPSGSMIPSLQINDRVLVEKLTFRKRSPRRGEVVVFNSPFSFDKKLVAQRSTKLPSNFKCAVLTFPLIGYLPGIGDQACDAYIKRVVAIGGDQVFINAKGEIFINNKLIKENYSPNYCALNSFGYGSCKTLKIKVPAFRVLVLGDNRPNSWDSRFWPGDPFLPEKEIIGRAILRFWPIPRIGSLIL